MLTERARRAACRRVGRDGLSVAAVAREYGTGWHTIMRAVWDHGAPLVDDPARLADVAMLGMDETAWLKANRWHHTMYVSGLVDTATGRLLDVVPDRTAKAVTTWLAQRHPDWLAARSAWSPSTRTAATPTPWRPTWPTRSSWSITST